MKLIVGGSGFRLFLKPGEGKTACVLKAFDILKKLGFVDCMLVIAPLRVITTSWPQQLRYWADFEHLSYQIVHGGPDARRAALETKADIYLMNVEGLLCKEWAAVNLNKGGKRPRYGPNAYAKEWLKSKRVMLVVDESTKFKNNSSLRAMTLKCYLPYTNRRGIMTGTPRPGKLEDLFFQCYITDLGEDLGEYITHFRREYMYPAPDGFGYVEQPGSNERVARKIAPTTLQLESSEVIPTQTIQVWVPIPAALMPKYKELAKEFLTRLGNDVVMAPNSGVLFGKLRQFAQGAIYDTLSNGLFDERRFIKVHDCKLDALENLLEELNGEPAFCLYQYGHDVLRIEERLGRSLPRIGGGVSAAQGAAWGRECGGGALPLLLGQPQSVALGVDGLQHSCNNIIWFGNDPSWENTYQANFRVARPGNKHDQVYIYHIMMECGVERAIHQIVTTKRENEQNFLDLLRENLKNE